MLSAEAKNLTSAKHLTNAETDQGSLSGRSCPPAHVLGPGRARAAVLEPPRHAPA